MANYRKIKCSVFGLTRQLRDINFLYLPLVARIILHDFDILLHIPSRKRTPLEVNTMLNSFIPATESVLLQFKKEIGLLPKCTNLIFIIIHGM